MNSKPDVNWIDPFDLDSPLTEEERMIGDTGRDYCQDKLILGRAQTGIQAFC
ncbi:MAG: hypothetical protein V7629_15180 [Motiliproteus sp.]